MKILTQNKILSQNKNLKYLDNTYHFYKFNFHNFLIDCVCM